VDNHEKMSYRQKFIQMNREARATWIAAAVLIAYWWIAGFGASHFDFTLFQMPGWFVLSCFGVWLLSIVLTVFLVTRVFRDFSLEDEED
jgi:uncharacterized membrane protein YhdT